MDLEDVKHRPGVQLKGRVPIPISAALCIALFLTGGFDQDLSSAYAQADCDGLHRMRPAPALEGIGANQTSADHELRAVAKKKCEDFCAFRRRAETDETPCQLDGFPITSKPRRPAKQPPRELKLVAELRYCPCSRQPTARPVPDDCTKGHSINPPHEVEGSGSNKGRARSEAFEHAPSICEAFCAAIDCERTGLLCDAVPPVTWDPRKPECAASGATWTCKTNVTRCKCQCLPKR